MEPEYIVAAIGYIVANLLTLKLMAKRGHFEPYTAQIWSERRGCFVEVSRKPSPLTRFLLMPVIWIFFSAVGVLEGLSFMRSFTERCLQNFIAKDRNEFQIQERYKERLQKLHDKHQHELKQAIAQLEEELEGEAKK